MDSSSSARRAGRLIVLAGKCLVEEREGKIERVVG